MKEPTINIDQETAEELVHILKEKFPNGNITPTAQSFRHFIRQHKLQRIITEAQNNFRKHITDK